MNRITKNTLTVTAIAVFASVSVLMAADKKLELELPKALFVGTPKTIKSGNLVAEKDNTKYVSPSIMVPEGIENIAEDKTVTSSDSMPIIGELELITDADKEGSDGSYVELGPGKQWIQIDLEEKSEIYAIAVWHYHSQARVYYDVVMQVSDDKDFLESTTVFNNDHDNSAGFGAGKQKEYIETNKGILLDAKKATGRYLRIYSNGSTSSEMNHYIEVEVYGKAAK